MSERISWLDGWRGLLCGLMIIYHLVFDLTLFGWVSAGITEWWPMFLLQRLSSLGFVFICGTSSRFTRSNLRRGLITFVAGMIVELAAAVVGTPIRYGMLQFLCSAMVFYHFFGKYFERVPHRVAPWLWAALYLATRVMSCTVFVKPTWLYWLGLRNKAFVSSDWVPFFPNIFMFLLGAWFGGRILSSSPDSRLRTMTAPRWLTWPGQRTLFIYLIHQPVLYGACWVANEFLA